MKLCAFIVTCSLVAGCAGSSYAALVGSSRPVAQKNFQQLIKNNECPSCDLAGVVLNRIDLSGANLEGANLAGAKLFLTDLSGANLRNANLQGAALGGADLAGADLTGANLTGAVLEGAFLTGAQLDGRIVTEKTYEVEGLSDVSESKYVSDESRGKAVPYTRDVVISDRRDLTETTPPPTPEKVQVQEKVVPEEIDDKETVLVHSKTLVPMSDAVVPDSPVDESAGEGEEEGGIWASVVSFFGGDSDDGQDGAAAEPAEEKSGTVEVQSVAAADSAHTGKDELPADAGVLTMIEQIEGPAPEESPEVVVEEQKVDVETIVDTESKTVQQSENHMQAENVPVETGQETDDAAQAVVEVAVPVSAQDAEQEEAAEPAADSSVGTMIARIEADQVEDTMPAVDSVYTVETPEQAQAKRRLIMAKLLDVGRCVACDLAGADLSGKELDESDLERANLAGADLEGVDLSESNLKGVDFSGANLRRADLREADLYLADFSGADLTGAKLEGALIDMADFTGARGADLEGTINE